MSVFIYVIDAADRIVSVSDNWLSFAEENQAGDKCHPDQVINEPIWKFIDGMETTHLYKVLISTVRTECRAVTLPYRCDASDCRRYLELRIAPVQQEHVEFFSRIIREEPRDCVELLQSGASRSEVIIKMCSMCKKIEVTDKDWSEVEIAISSLRLFEENELPQISHGLCPECFQQTMAELKGTSQNC